MKKIVLSCLLPLSAVCGAQEVESEDRPNILWIMCDDHTANTISYYNGRYSDILKTPNIDRVGQDGAILNNCFVTNSISVPSRATIITGKYGHKTDVHTLWDELSIEETTVPILLQKNGYQTAVIGKWHLKNQPQGFDYYSVLHGQGDYFNPIFITSNQKWSSDKKVGRKINGYVTDIITNEAIDWIETTSEKEPFFLMLHHKAPHGLWEYAPRHKHILDGIEIPEPESLKEDKRHRSEGSEAFGRDMLNLSQRMAEAKNGKEYPTGKLDITGMTDDQKISAAYQKYLRDYLRVVAAIDENVGRVLDYLDKSGKAENTIVVYTSDQGMFLGEHSYYDKRWIYDESLKMPFMIRKPGEIIPGTKCDDMVTNLDFAELILDYADVSIPKDMQGLSFRDNLAGNTPSDWPTSMYYHYWMHFRGSGVPAHFGVRTHDYKLIFFYGSGLGHDGTTADWETPIGWELYDLKNDPFEMNNIYGNTKHKRVVKDMKKELLKLQKKYEVDIENYPELVEIIKDNWK